MFAIHKPTGDRAELVNFKLADGQTWEIRFNDYDMRAELMLGNGLRWPLEVPLVEEVPGDD